MDSSVSIVFPHSVKSSSQPFHCDSMPSPPNGPSPSPEKAPASLAEELHQPPLVSPSETEEPKASDPLTINNNTNKHPSTKVLKRQKTTVGFFQPPTTVLEVSMTDDVALNVRNMKDQMRALEYLHTAKRRQSVAVASNNEVTVIDGTCSCLCLRYFFDLISISGLKEISRAKHPLVKCLWIITFILSVSVTAFYMTRSLNTYFDEPTATKVKLIRNTSYEYPEMLLCPDVWLDRQKALQLGATEGAIQYALGYLVNYNFRSPPYEIEKYVRAKHEFDTWYRERNYSSLVDVFKDFALDSETFFFKCPYCQYKNFTKYIMDETVCYKIPMYWMSGKGTSRSAIDILEVTIPNRSGNILHRKKYWRFYVEPDLHIGLSTVRYVQVFPGFSNTIRFTPLRYLVIHKDDDPCVPVEKASQGYSMVECAMACSNEQKECKSLGSIRQTLPTPNVSEICHYYPPNYKILQESIRPEMKLIDLITEECFKKCPPLCERWMFEASVESHKISSYVPPENNASDAEPVPMTRVYLLNQAPLQGGYMSFTEVNTYSFDILLGNIGGVLSLWLGASIMSFIQILVFSITWCFARHLNRKQDNNDDEESQTYDDDLMTSYRGNGSAKV